MVQLTVMPKFEKDDFTRWVLSSKNWEILSSARVIPTVKLMLPRKQCCWKKTALLGWSHVGICVNPKYLNRNYFLVDHNFFVDITSAFSINSPL